MTKACKCGVAIAPKEWKCKECKTAYYRAYYASHVKEYKQYYLNAAPRARAYQKKRREEAHEMLEHVREEFRKDGCKVCGEKAACCLSAHHLDPTTKEFMLASAWGFRPSEERLRRELAKCVCLCENCHRKVHAGLIKLGA